MGIAGYVGVLLIVTAVVLALLALRRLRLLRAGGIHVALRIGTGTGSGGRGWHLGVGRYHGDQFVWYRALSVRSGPTRIISRDGLEIAERREPAGPETYAMPQGATVLRCLATTGEVEIAMSTDALTGFLSWLESAPPGRSVRWAS